MDTIREWLDNEKEGFADWFEENLEELAREYVADEYFGLDKDGQFKQWERIVDLYNSTYDTDEGFDEFVQNAWAENLEDQRERWGE